MKKIIINIWISFLAILLIAFLLFPKNSTISKEITINYASSNQKINNKNETYANFKKLIDAVEINNNSPIFYLIKKINSELYPNEPEVTLSQAIIDNVGTLTPKIVDQLQMYNDQNLGGWTLELRGLDWNNIDLLLLEAFAEFNNITSIEIVVSSGSISQSSTPFNIETFKNISVFNKLPNIERLQFKFEDPISTSQKISYEDLNVLVDLKDSLKHLDVKSLVNTSGQSIFSDSPVLTNWFINMEFGFKLWTPLDTQVPGDEFNTYYVSTKTQSDGVEFKEIIKNASAPIPLPTNYDYSPIYIDDDYLDPEDALVEATLYENNWYWMLDDVDVITKVVSQAKNTRRYYTTLKTGSSFQLLSKRTTTYAKNMNKTFLEEQKIDLPRPEIPLTKENAIEVINTPIYIDNQPYYYEVKDSIAYLSFDINKINFANYQQTKYYTSITQALPDMAVEMVGSTKDANYRFVEIKGKNVPEPEKVNSEINFDQKTIDTVVANNIPYWNFSNKDYQGITYYSEELNHLFSSIEEVLKLTEFPSDLTIALLPQKHPVLTNSLIDIGLISSNNYSRLDESILIDENVITPVLRRGYIYWDFPIEDVKYIIITEDDVNHYFTTFEKASQFSSYKYYVNSIIPPTKRFIPRAEKIVEASAISKTTIFIDGSPISKVLRNGKFYWNNIDFGITLKSIKYVNENGYYFTSLPYDLFDTNISEVYTQDQDDEAKLSSKYNPFYKSNNTLTNENFENFLKPLFIDNISYEFKFLNSKPLLPSKADTSKIKYVVDFDDLASNKFLTELDILNYKHISESNSFIIDTFNDQTIFPSLNNPSVENEEKIFINNEGENIVITGVMNDETGILNWNNAILSGANYLLVDKQGNEFYANTLNDKTMVNIEKVSNINKVKTLAFIDSTPDSLKRDYDNIALYLIIGSISAILLLGFIYLIILLSKQRKGA